PQIIDNTLYDAFGQRQVSTMYTPLNQYHVVMEADPKFWQSPDGLKYIYLQPSATQPAPDGPSGSSVLPPPVATPPGQSSSSPPQIPLSAVAHYATKNTALSVAHSGQFPSITVSFNLLPGVALGDAVVEIQQAERDMGLPASIHG